MLTLHPHSGKQLHHGTSPKFLLSSTSLLAPMVASLAWHGSMHYFCSSCNSKLWVSSIRLWSHSKYAPPSMGVPTCMLGHW